MKFHLVGIRQGKRVLNWPGLLGVWLLVVAVSVVAAFAIDWILDAVFQIEAGDRTRGPVRNAFPMSTLLLVWVVRSQWKRPCEQLPALDQPTSDGGA